MEKFHDWTCRGGILSGSVLEFTELLRRIHKELHAMSFRAAAQIFAEAECVPGCLVLYTCGLGSDWNACDLDG